MSRAGRRKALILLAGAVVLWGIGFWMGVLYARPEPGLYQLKPTDCPEGADWVNCLPTAILETPE